MPANVPPRWLLHHLRTRTVLTVYGVVPCRCAWWRRLLYLVTFR